MIIETERRLMSLLIDSGDGMLHRQVFAEMDEARARQLVREYGYDPSGVYAIVHETVVFRRELDDSEVLAVLDCIPYREYHTMEELLEAVRCLVPQARRIVRLQERWVRVLKRKTKGL